MFFSVFFCFLFVVVVLLFCFFAFVFFFFASLFHLLFSLSLKLIFCIFCCLNPHIYKMGFGVPKHYFSTNRFYGKNPRKLSFYVFLHYNARKHLISSFYLKRTNFTINLKFGTKFTISYKFGLLYVKSWCHTFSNIKKEEYMEFDCFVIFWVKVVTKNILTGSRRRNPKLFLNCDVSF